MEINNNNNKTYFTILNILKYLSLTQIKDAYDDVINMKYNG